MISILLGVDDHVVDIGWFPRWNLYMFVLNFMISYELETCKFGCSWCIIWWFHLCLRCACKVFDKMPKELEIMQYNSIVTKWRIHDMPLRSNDFYVDNVPCKCCWNTHELFLWDYAMFTCKSYLWTRCMITMQSTWTSMLLVCVANMIMQWTWY